MNAHRGSEQEKDRHGGPPGCKLPGKRKSHFKDFQFSFKNGNENGLY